VLEPAAVSDKRKSNGSRRSDAPLPLKSSGRLTEEHVQNPFSVGGVSSEPLVTKQSTMDVFANHIDEDE
jgi:hypothetical protein